MNSNRFSHPDAPRSPARRSRKFNDWRLCGPPPQNCRKQLAGSFPQRTAIKRTLLAGLAGQPGNMGTLENIIELKPFTKHQGWYVVGHNLSQENQT